MLMEAWRTKRNQVTTSLGFAVTDGVLSSFLGFPYLRFVKWKRDRNERKPWECGVNCSVTFQSLVCLLRGLKKISVLIYNLCFFILQLGRIICPTLKTMDTAMWMKRNQMRSLTKSLKVTTNRWANAFSCLYFVWYWFIECFFFKGVKGGADEVLLIKKLHLLCWPKFRATWR